MNTIFEIRTLLLWLLLLFITPLSAQNAETESNDEYSPNTPRLILWDNNVNFPNNVNLYPCMGNDSVPPYEIRAILKCNVGYTFNKIFNFSDNHTVSITVDATTPCNVYLFNTSQPQSNSYSIKVPANTLGVVHGTANWTLSQSGEYMLLITCCEGYTTGRCNVTIDLQSFNNVYIANSYYAYTLGTSHEYNIFTNRTNDNLRLCALQGSEPGIIVAYNDDYSGNGDFNWGNNPRIKKQFSNPISGVLLFPEYKTGSLASSMIRYADLYIGAQADPTILPYFPRLKLDDALRTAPESYLYNCISWAGGEWIFEENWNFGEWPPSVYSQYFDPNPLTAFDNYFNSKGFTRNGATEQNAAIDLWAQQGVYTHASVKNKAHRFATGYAWESKLGKSIRVMHPRYALKDSIYGIYGDVVEHYTPISSYTHVESVIENTSFSPLEINKINMMKNSLPSSLVNTFNEKYTLMKEDTTFFLQSDLSKYRYSPYYTQLLSICLNNPNVISLAYEKLNEGDFLASILIEGITLTQNMDVASLMWNYNDSLLVNTNIRRTNLSNAIMYSKGVLAKQMNNNYSLMLGNTSYSNDEAIFGLDEMNGIIDISLTLQESTNVHISISSSNGQYTKTIMDKKIGTGEQHFKVAPPQRGLYNIQVILNGRIYSKKINLK